MTTYQLGETRVLKMLKVKFQLLKSQEKLDPFLYIIINSALILGKSHNVVI